ncbi:hypothetical protein A1O3_02765 [Capronia epimyces CBS 606.96]|uniref:GPI anchored serine-threonine rich protein n=1 Tax=Capronia epimyces CBS 606.96 TaxID=1182542 RepID=W9YAZ5_9EURO|nr:uncharacterized protein A1O3_02765 [Capronia epimyces CBS 606.96]EXJ89698.1 hypothetical protein A1O3_02765 [Capronia epimyces CBS 606.96]
MRSFYFLAALPLLVSAWTENTLLTRASSGNETSCDSGDKACGSFCIPDNYTCCPDLEGGCPATSVCTKGDNGVYGCCGKGEYCKGDGGSEFIDGDSSSSTSTANAAAATKTGDSSSGADSIVLGQGLTLAAVAAGLVALL